MADVIPLWLVTTLSFATVFSVMTSIGTTITPGAVLGHLRAPSLLIRGLVSVLVVVPVVGFTAGFAFGLDRAEQVGIALMAIAPGAPLALRRALRSGGHVGFAPTLQIALAVLAVPAMPLWVMIGNWILGTNGFVDVAAVTRQVFLAQLLPLGLGAITRSVAPKSGERIGNALARAGAVLLIVMIVAEVIDLRAIILAARPWPMAAAVATTLAALAAGHLLGGPMHETRHAVAVAGAMRNVGLALLVATANHVLPAVQVVIISYMLVAAVVVTVYILLRGKWGQV
jgi:bile acid:Na+ symporter, BASS family